MTDSKTHRGWRRREKARVGVEAYGCLVCQACDVRLGLFFSLSTTEYGDIVSVVAPHPCQRGAQLGLKLIRRTLLLTSEVRRDHANSQ